MWTVADLHKIYQEGHGGDDIFQFYHCLQWTGQKLCNQKNFPRWWCTCYVEARWCLNLEYCLSAKWTTIFPYENPLWSCFNHSIDLIPNTLLGRWPLSSRSFTMVDYLDPAKSIIPQDMMSRWSCCCLLWMTTMITSHITLGDLRRNLEINHCYHAFCGVSNFAQ